MQAYYAVKANPDPAIVRTLYRTGASFDVASIAEFLIVHENIKDLPPKERQDFIWDKIIYANPIKTNETLAELDQYKPLVTYDNFEEIKKVQKHAPQAGLALRLQVPNTGAMVELSCKFGAIRARPSTLIEAAHEAGLTVEGLSFHVGSQTTNFENYVQALNLAAGIFKEAKDRGFPMKLLDIGGGFPAPYDSAVPRFEAPGPADQRRARPALSPSRSRSSPSRAGSWWPPPPRRSPRSSARPAATASPATTSTTASTTPSRASSSTTASTTSRRSSRDEPRSRSVFGPTCDALDTISLAEELPDLELGDLVYSENIGAYSHASSTWFNGFPGQGRTHQPVDG